MCLESLRRRFKTCLIRFPIAPFRVRISHIGRKRGADRTSRQHWHRFMAILFLALCDRRQLVDAGCRGGVARASATLHCTYTPRSHSFSHCCNQPTRCVLHYKSISALYRLLFAFKSLFRYSGRDMAQFLVSLTQQ